MVGSEVALYNLFLEPYRSGEKEIPSDLRMLLDVFLITYNDTLSEKNGIKKMVIK